MVIVKGIEYQRYGKGVVSREEGSEDDWAEVEDPSNDVVTALQARDVRKALTKDLNSTATPPGGTGGEQPGPSGEVTAEIITADDVGDASDILDN